MSLNPLKEQHPLARIESVFAATFADYGTVLVGGSPEPLYRPGEAAGELHTIFYREDYLASALHEVAHWCIAGSERRQRVDFGYWYEPDGRDTLQQQAFEKVEVKPQALEWFFAQACGVPFTLSADNLSGPGEGVAPGRDDHFADAVVTQAKEWQAAGLPERASAFFHALVETFGSGLAIGACEFSREALR